MSHMIQTAHLLMRWVRSELDEAIEKRMEFIAKFNSVKGKIGKLILQYSEESPHDICPHGNRAHEPKLFIQYSPDVLNGVVRAVILWFHDDSTFYANDRMKMRWCPKSQKIRPTPKGEGASRMVADFVSGEFGPLRGKNGESAQRFLSCGINKEGYWTNEEILKQADGGMVILGRDYPQYDHILVYDNAPTHHKRPDNGLSAKGMQRNPTLNFPPEKTANVRQADGSIKKVAKPKCLMRYTEIPAVCQDGNVRLFHQTFYDPPEAGQSRGKFKGTERLLLERGYSPDWLRSRNNNCRGQDCVETDCCLQNTMYNQWDVVSQKSALQELVENTTINPEDPAPFQRKFQLWFLPRFHCELNPIERYWMKAKMFYRRLPLETKMAEATLKQNLIDALNSVSHTDIARYANRYRRWIHAYRRLAEWNAKQKSHRNRPPKDIETLLDEVDHDPQLRGHPTSA